MVQLKITEVTENLKCIFIYINKDLKKTTHHQNIVGKKIVFLNFFL